jgi:peptide/nickel transport system substrate-binding protein
VSRSRRRRLAATLLALVLVGVGTAVGVRAARSPAPGPATASAPAAAGGTLRLLSADRWPTLDPAALVSPQQRDVGRLLYRTLMTYGSDGRSVVPDLATGPGTPSSGGRVWTYHLAPSRYEDGAALVAGDVVRGMRRSLARRGLPAGWLAAATAPDAATVVLAFRRPFADADWFAALTGAAPVPAAGVRASGPYRVASRTSGSFRLVRNEHWTGSRPGPDEVDAELGLASTGIDQRLLASSGEDAFAVTDKPVLGLARVPDDRRVSGPDGSVLFTALDLRRGPFVDLKVRQALEVAFPVAEVRSAGTTPATDLLPPPFPGHRDLDLYGGKDHGHAGDPATARQMLRAAGYQQPVVVRAAVPRSAAAMGAVLRTALDAAGFDVRLRVIPDASYYATVGVAATQPDLVSYAWSPDWPTASAVLPPLFGCQALTATGNANVANHCDKGFDQQMARSLAELDPKRRAVLWQALDERLVAEAVVVPRAFGTSSALVGTRVRHAESALCYGGAVDLLRLTLQTG